MLFLEPLELRRLFSIALGGSVLKIHGELPRNRLALQAASDNRLWAIDNNRGQIFGRTQITEADLMGNPGDTITIDTRLGGSLTHVFAQGGLITGVTWTPADAPVPPSPPAPSPPPPAPTPTPAPAPTPSDQVIPVFTLSATQVIASQCLTVRCQDLTLIRNAPLEACRIEWDFGEPGSTYNQIAGGFSAGHVYDTPGAHTITLKITDPAGNIGVTSRIVTVLSDNRPTFYIDSQDAADHIQLGPDRRILFVRGKTYDFAGPDNGIYANFPNLLIGSYGDSNLPLPVIRYTGQNQYTPGVIFCWDNSNGVTIQDLTLTTADGARLANAVTPGHGRNLTVRRCIFQNIASDINFEGFGGSAVIQDNQSPDATKLHGYGVWLYGRDLVLLGNSFANSTIEHDVRGVGWDGVLIVGGDLSNTDSDGAGPDFPKSTINLQPGKWAYVLGVRLHQGDTEIGAFGGQDGVTEHVVFDGVFAEKDSVLQIMGGAKHIWIRGGSYTPWAGRPAVTIEGKRPDGRMVDDVHFWNVTVGGNNSGIIALGEHGSIDIVNLTDVRSDKSQPLLVGT